MGGSSKHVLPVYLDGAKQVLAEADFGDNNLTSWNGLTSSVQINNDLTSNSTLRLGVPNHYGTVVFILSKDVNSQVTISDYTSGSDVTVKRLNAANESVTLMYNGSTWVEIAATESSVPTIDFGDLDNKPTTLSGYGITDVNPSPKTFEHSATLAFNGIDGSLTNYAAGDCMNLLNGALDVPAQLPAGSKIIIHDVIVVIETACNLAINGRLELSNSDSVLTNDAVSGTAIMGTGSALQEGETSATIPFNTAGTYIFRSEAIVANDRVNLYMVTESAITAAVSSGKGRVLIRYSVF